MVSATVRRCRRSLSALSAGAIAVALLAASCTSVDVQPQAGASEMLPAPQKVLVYNFAVTPSEVQLDPIGSRITQSVDGTASSAQEQKVGHAVADALAKELVENINGMGLYAVRASGPVPATGTVLLTTGQLLSINQGNEAERVLIGLGAGRSDVQAHVQVTESVNGQLTRVEAMQGTAKSTLAPGAAETLGAGAIAGHLVVSAAVTAGSQVANQELSANVESEGEHLADKISDQLKSLFVSQGWIPAS